MKAFTLWQPWASLVIAMAKPYEFRGWCPPDSMIGQRIGIHAGAPPIKRSEVQDLLLRLQGPLAWTTCLKPEIAIPILERVLLNPGILPRAAMLGTVTLGKPVISREIAGEFGGVINDSTRDEHCNWAWPMIDVLPFAHPIPMRGAQGFWIWREEM